MDIIKLKFIHNNKEAEIKGKRNEKFKDIFQRYLSQTHQKDQSINFLYNSIIINEELTINNINNSDNEIQIIVKEKKPKENNNKISELKDILCPICKHSCLINIKNFKINLWKCDYNPQHSKKNILLKDYGSIQSIKYNKCHNLNDNKVYRCYTCEKDLCSKCKDIHDKEHIVINYEIKNYMCKKHCQFYQSYCEECRLNLCNKCDLEHDKKHKIKYLDEYKINFDLNDNMKILRKKINEFIEYIKKIINKLNDLINNMEIYYNINTDLMNCYQNKYRNYQILKNIQNMNEYNKNVIGDINQILFEKDIKNKINSIYDIYKKISIKPIKTFILISMKGGNRNNLYNDEITIKYKIDRNKKKLIIFGNEFVKNNKDNCKLLINNNLTDLTSFLDLNSYNIENDFLEIKLRIFDDLKDLSHMFFGCSSLLSLPDFSELKTDNITKMNHLFMKCESLSLLSDISKWNTSNVTDMSYMFYDCKSLSELPNISKWDITKVSDIRYIFCGCKSLLKLPDISKWNTSTITNLSYIFSECYSLKSLPDISKWNTNKVTDINHMFYNCSSLEKLPDISKWKFSKLENIIYLFSGCKTLKEIPDISKWDISNVINLIHIFDSCEALENLPDLSKWNTSNVIDMSYVFYNCYNLISLPNISKWKTEKTINMSYMFYCCQTLNEIPDISDWDISNVTNLSYMFNGCDSLTTIPDIRKWNLKNVTDISYLLANCFSLKLPFDKKELKISHIDKKDNIFYFCGNNLNDNQIENN